MSVELESASVLSKQINVLNRLSQENAIDPLVSLDFSNAPSPDQFWMSEHLISLYGEPEYEQLNYENKKKLSQLEFSLLCSLSCIGESEVISAVMQLMLRSRYEAVRKYLYFFIKEENNHIYMFSEFSRRYGKLYPVTYSHVISTTWEEPLLNDLLIFVNILIFEELINDLNRVLAKDQSLPILIRELNRIHSLDEGRHIAFGRQLLKTLAEDVLQKISLETLSKIQKQIADYLSVRHHEYHNVEIYRTIGILNPIALRDRLIGNRNINYFARDKQGKEKLISVIRFLKQLNLLEENYDQK